MKGVPLADTLGLDSPGWDLALPQPLSYRERLEPPVWEPGSTGGVLVTLPKPPAWKPRPLSWGSTPDCKKRGSCFNFFPEPLASGPFHCGE